MKLQQEHSHSNEFMLSEYEQVHAHLRDEIRKSEERVNFFLTIASLASGGLIFLAQTTAIAFQVKSPVSLGVLIVLFIYGLTTLNRLNARIAQVSAYNRLLSKIHQYFARQDPEVEAYVKYVEESFGMPKHRTLGLRIWG